ncbi:MAG: crotonyl-CoA carboxylase/reductase [Gammaproteobacteria bacterium]|nr:crotonyl-CoA carboxylase/reductase [Gammaproteobacteria bacterium]
MTKELYDIGEAPPLGEVPPKMHAWLIRGERFGEPTTAFQKEVVDVPEIADDDVLVYVMAAGVNYNNVWAALGIPVNVIKARQKSGEIEDFHIGGSDASGIVYKVGKDVTNVKVGDEVVVHCGTWDRNCPHVQAGKDPMYSPTFRIWGYETNYGSFAQFTKVQGHQCMPKPKHMTWESAAAYALVGATAYRMLHGWSEHSIRPGDVALIWGGAGGLGSMAIQICKAAGAKSIAVISNNNKVEYCEKLGAEGCINRNDFDHWGMLPHWKDNVGYGNWLKGVRKFGAAIWEVLGEKKSPNLVFEHPGETTMPTSMFVCETGGSVVICAGTTGYNATVDLRYLWMRQKRVQGSHFANDEQSYAMNQLAIEGHLDPCLSRSFTYEELPDAHQLMYENKHPHGNMSVLIGATDFGQGSTAEAPVPKPIDASAVPFTQINPNPNPFPIEVPVPGILADSAEDMEPVMADDGTKVKDLMFLGLIACRPQDSVETVARTMIGNDIHAVIVREGDRAIGVVSQTDVVLARQGRSAEALRAMTARDIMNEGCMTCDQETALSDAVTTMTKLHIHRLVVTESRDGHDVPVGIVSLTDVVRKLVVEN